MLFVRLKLKKKEQTKKEDSLFFTNSDLLSTV